MLATQQRQIQGQPGYTGNRRRAETVSVHSRCPLPYNEKSYAAQPEGLDGPSRRRATVSGGSYHPSTSPSDTRSNSSPRTGLSISRPPAPAPNSSSSSSSKSVTWGESDSDERWHIGPGQYSVCSRECTSSPKCAPKPILKTREVKVLNISSPSDPDTPIIAASKAIDNILIELIPLVKNFKAPRELDFAKAGSGMMLACTEKNKAFINQLRNLDRLRTKLAAIPTHDNGKLMDKQNRADAAIARTLERMKEHQLKLYENFMDAINEALEAIAIDLSAWVNHFEYPSKLDFPANSEGGMVLLNTERNKPFIDQLHRLAWFRDRLDGIPVHENEQLQDKRRAIGEVLERAFERMEEHQLKLYRHRHTRRH